MQSNWECVNRGAGYGLEISVQYRFIGVKKAIEWAEKNIKKVFENINKKVNKCIKQKAVKEKKLINNFSCHVIFAVSAL